MIARSPDLRSSVEIVFINWTKSDHLIFHCNYFRKEGLGDQSNMCSFAFNML